MVTTLWHIWVKTTVWLPTTTTCSRSSTCSTTGTTRSSSSYCTTTTTTSRVARALLVAPSIYGDRNLYEREHKAPIWDTESAQKHLAPNLSENRHTKWTTLPRMYGKTYKIQNPPVPVKHLAPNLSENRHTKWTTLPRMYGKTYKIQNPPVPVKWLASILCTRSSTLQ